MHPTSAYSRFVDRSKAGRGALDGRFRLSARVSFFCRLRHRVRLWCNTHSVAGAMGVGLEQWRAAIGLYNAGRSRSSALVRCHRTNLESTLELLLQLASVDPTAAFTFAKAMGISVEQWRAMLLVHEAAKARSSDHSSNTSSCPTVSTILSRLLVGGTAAFMTALMLLILLSGDVERNPGPDLDGELVP